MIVITSPAKTLDFEDTRTFPEASSPDYLKETRALIKEAKKLSRTDLAEKMKLSDELAELNFKRFRKFKTPFTKDNARPAIYAFKGDTFRALDEQSLSSDDLDYAQRNFRILSGLYGLLRPKDLMQAYRLEMGTKLENSAGTNLYQFWGDRLAKGLSKLMKENNTDLLINCASNEYFKAVKPKALEGKVITPVFKQEKDGKARVMSYFAKAARGMMARYVIQNRLTDPKDLRNFNLDGYKFMPALSNETRLEFHKRID